MPHQLLPRLTSLLGLCVMVALAFLLSENRREARLRILLWGLGLQMVLGVLVLRTRLGLMLFERVRDAFNILTDATAQGAGFLFGTLPTNPEIGAIFAFQVLPVIVFVSALAGVLHHLGVIQVLVTAIASVMRRTMRTSGAETFGASLLIFTGIESITALRGYLDDLTRSELFTLMTTFMSTIAASVMVAYASFGAEPGHLLAASLMSAPAAIVISKLMVPETATPRTDGTTRITVRVESHNVVDAAARGAADGLNIALNVGAMLIAFIGIVYLLNLALKGILGVSFEQLMGYFFRPFAFLMGVPRHDVAAVSELLGTKTILNEFLAYAQLQPLIESGALSRRSITIATYALCGFANPGSLGILIGATARLMPRRREEIVGLALKSLIAGTLACFTTACVVGLLIDE